MKKKLLFKFALIGLVSLLIEESTAGVLSVKGGSSSLAGPDLTIVNPTLTPSSGGPNDVITANCSVSNTGTSVAASTWIGYYLSTNTTLDGSDVYYGSLSTPSLNPGTSTYISAYITLPYGTAPGNYYILFVADNGDYVAESNENNNVGYSSITITAPDLIILNPTINPSSAAPNDPITTTCSVSNSGISAAASSTVGYYLSSNTTLDGSDVYCGSLSTPSLNPGTSSSVTKNITIPYGTVPGSYYLLFVTDYDDNIIETNESNNVGYFSVTVTAPDLIIQSPTINTSNAVSGYSVTTKYLLKNQGSANTYLGSVKVDYYLSTNTTLDGSDLFAGNYYYYSNLSAGTSDSINANIYIPTVPAAGNYYLLFVVDIDNNEIETDENNNVASSGLFAVRNPEIDFTIQSPAANVTGNTINTSCTIENLGLDASGTILDYYFSSDTILDGSDVFLNDPNKDVDYVVPNISGGGNTVMNNPFPIPAGTTAGNYYIIFYVDEYGYPTETDANNNLAFSAISVGSVTGFNHNAKGEFNIYPNPTAGRFSVELKNSITTETVIYVFNQLGELIQRNETVISGSSILGLDLSGNPSGIYTVKITSGNKEKILKVVLQ